MSIRLETAAIFSGFEPTKNADYITCRLCVAELYNGTPIPVESMVKPNVSIVIKVESNEFKLIQNLKALTKYLFLFGLDIEPPQQNYPAKLKYSLYSVKELKAA